MADTYAKGTNARAHGDAVVKKPIALHTMHLSELKQKQLRGSPSSYKTELIASVRQHGID